MPRCEDCGCSTNGGICSNCQEELYIATYQADCIEGPLSKEFTEKIEEQQKLLAQREAKDKN
jgi:hypothetical protein